jgi:O-antigen/teichoic acid export membrane protein
MANLESTQISAHAMLMMFSKTVSHLCFLLIAVVLARSLEQADFGTFSQVWLVNKSLIYLFALGLPVSVYYFLPRLSAGKAKSFVVQTILSLAILALPFSLFTYLLADTVAVYFQNPELAGYLRLFAIYPLMVLPTIATDAVLISLGRTKQAAVFEIISKVAMILAVGAAGILGHRLDLVFKALILHALVQLLLALWVMWQPLRRLKSDFSRADLKSQIAFAMPYGLSDLAGVLNYQADKVLVALFYPPAAFAVYAAGAFEIPLAGVTSVPVLSVSVAEFTKRFTAGDVEGFLRLWHQSLLKLALPVFAVAAFLMVFAEPVVTGLFSSEYAASVWPFQIYLLLLPMRITVPGQVLASLGETKFVFKAMAASLIVNVVLGYMLIRSVGWLGPAFSAVCSGYLFATLIMLAIQNRLAVGVQRLMPWKALGRVALVAIVAALASLPVAFLPIGAVWKLGAGCVIYGAVYVMGNIKTNSITPRDIETLWSWISSNSRGAIGSRGDLKTPSGSTEPFHR